MLKKKIDKLKTIKHNDKDRVNPTDLQTDWTRLDRQRKRYRYDDEGQTWHEIS